MLHAGSAEGCLFINADADGRDPVVQEQVLACHALRQLKHNAKLMIRRQLAVKPGLPSGHPKFCLGSVVLAEELAKDCGEFAGVTVEHMCVHRWDASYPVLECCTEVALTSQSAQGAEAFDALVLFLDQYTCAFAFSST